LASGDVTTANAALKRILESFPNGFQTERAVLLAGLEISRTGQPAQAREIFLKFLERAPDAPLAPQVRLAIARTYEQQDRWDDAITLYDQCLGSVTNSETRAQANYQAGHDTNAFICFTNFITEFPTNDLAASAQWWVADHYFRNGDFLLAEYNYQLIYQKWPASKLAYQAKLMAGRVALTRQKWPDAIQYLTNLINDLHCPTNVRVQALFAYGDTLMSRGSSDTNQLADYDEAISVFRALCRDYPTNQIAALAWGEMAECYLQWAQYSHDFKEVTNAFQQVIDAPRAGVAARAAAKVGLGVVLEKQAEQASGPEQLALLRMAFNHYFDVFRGTILRDNEEMDLYWKKKAGLEAGRVAEALKEWSWVIEIDSKVAELAPALAPRLQKSILKAGEQQRLAGEKN